jgi:hypothetical protein
VSTVLWYSESSKDDYSFALALVSVFVFVFVFVLQFLVHLLFPKIATNYNGQRDFVIFWGYYKI